MFSPAPAQRDLAPLWAWINERHAIYMRKAIIQDEDRGPFGRFALSARGRAAWGDSGPEAWTLDRLTADPILREYRFCNVYRELDRVTIWIRKNIREPYADHPNLWFMLAAARYINWPPTLQLLIDGNTAGAGKDAGKAEGWVCSWPSSTLFQPGAMTWVMENARGRGEKVETGAYMIRAESDRNAPWYDWSKQRYVAEVVLGKLWERRDDWREFLEQHRGNPDNLQLQTVWAALQDKHYTGWGPFMAYQVCVDLRWTRYLRNAPDVNTWAAVGPGSRRGLNRLHGRPADAPLSQEAALREMLAIREAAAEPGALAPWVKLPDLSDIQNSLCEVDKYLRVRNGEGRPRSKYIPGRGW